LFADWILVVLVYCRSLVYDGSQMLFYTGDMRSGSPTNTTHAISITNTFNVTVVVHNIGLAPTSRDMFTVSFTAAIVLLYCTVAGKCSLNSTSDLREP